MKNKYTHQEPITAEFTTKWFDFTGGVNTKIDDRQESHSLNIDVDMKGNAKIRKGWKTFDGMVKVFEELNDRYKKYGYVGDFTLRLPLRRYKRKV